MAEILLSQANQYGRPVASLDTPRVAAILSVAGFAEQAYVTDAMLGGSRFNFVGKSLDQLKWPDPLAAGRDGSPNRLPT